MAKYTDHHTRLKVAYIIEKKTDTLHTFCTLLLNFGWNVCALIMGASIFQAAFATILRLPANSSNIQLHTRHTKMTFWKGTGVI